MDVIISLIMILIIIGIILLIKNKIKFKIKEGVGGSIINEDEEEEEEDIKPKEDSTGYELVGEVPPPSYKDAIYDYNLKYAKTVWEELGCDPQSKYAPNVHNKDNLFGSTHGWAREDYKFRVKSLNVEANKAEYNYYDWGKYKYRNAETQGEKELGDGETTGNDANTEEKANLWDMDKEKIGSNWKTTINRPKIVKYPMGIRKAKTLCFGKDPGDYTPPKIGDKVKIRQKVNYNSPYFAGIVVADKVDKEDTDPVEVLWYQKGTATIEPKSNKIVNYFNNDYCDLNDISKDLSGCTRNLTQSSQPEEIIDFKSSVNNSVGWKLFGKNKNGGNGQQDWFGSPDLSLTTYAKVKGDPTKTLDKLGTSPWKSRYLKDTVKKIPEKLLNYDGNLNTIKPNGSVDPRAVFKIKECQTDSACEDLRCSTIAEKIKKKYPLTKVCKLEKKNTYTETNGQYCERGKHKGAIFTYYNKPPLCSFQDYGGNRDSEAFPKTFCKPYCGNNCKDISKKKGNWKTSYYAEVWSENNYKGQKAIVRGLDGKVNAANLFPDGSKQIKSLKLYGKNCAAMMSNYNTDMKPIVTFRNSEQFNLPVTILDNKTESSYKYIEICKYHIFNGRETLVEIENGAPNDSFFEDVPIPNLKAKYLSINGLLYGDQNWGNLTKCKITAHNAGGGENVIGLVPMNTTIGQTPHSNRKGWNYMKDPSDRYGKSLKEFDENKENMKKWQKEADASFSCDHWKAIGSVFLMILAKDSKKFKGCAQQKADWVNRVLKARSSILEAMIKSRSIIKLKTNENANKLFKINGTKKINKLRLSPSTIGSGHESMYLGFSGITIYESLK